MQEIMEKGGEKMKKQNIVKKIVSAAGRVAGSVVKVLIPDDRNGSISGWRQPPH